MVNIMTLFKQGEGLSAGVIYKKTNKNTREHHYHDSHAMTEVNISVNVKSWSHIQLNTQHLQNVQEF